MPVEQSVDTPVAGDALLSVAQNALEDLKAVEPVVLDACLEFRDGLPGGCEWDFKPPR